MLKSLVREFEQCSSSCLMIGWRVKDDADCEAYFRGRVRAKLKEWNGAELLRDYVRDVKATGFDVAILTEQIVCPPLPQDWEIGEAFAEVFLEDYHEAFFPWPRSFDKRTPVANLPGPDLVGFRCSGRKKARFLFGEVKSSSQDDPRNLLLCNQDSLSTQLLRLLTSEEHRQQLIQWMLVRARNSEWQSTFNMALIDYCRGSSCIIGVMVRGGNRPDIAELAKVHEKLANTRTSYDVMLIGLYLPFHKDKWVEIVYGGGETK